jgi:hypothetical protein
MVAPVISMDGKRDKEYCHFCSKSDEEVRVLLRGTASTICDGCVFRCVAILEDKGIVIPALPSPSGTK